MGAVGAYLERIFRASEEENRQAIMGLLAGRRAERLLDLGCYDGAFTSRLAECVSAGEVAGVEFLEEHASKARAKGIEVRAADLNGPLPFDDGEFDLVHANQVIEHLKRTDLFLAEIRRLLGPGGVAVLSTNNLSSWHNIASLVLGYQPFPAHVSDEVIVGNPLSPFDGQRHADPGQTHLRLFTARALAALAEHHGLRPEAMSASGYYPLPPRAARTAARLDPRHAAFLIGVFAPA